jgi:hypothetical protein
MTAYACLSFTTEAANIRLLYPFTTLWQRILFRSSSSVGVRQRCQTSQFPANPCAGLRNRDGRSGLDEAGVCHAPSAIASEANKVIPSELIWPVVTPLSVRGAGAACYIEIEVEGEPPRVSLVVKPVTIPELRLTNEL